MQCTEEMLNAAVKKAVAVGLIPKYAAGEEVYLKNWDGVKAVVEAALAMTPYDAIGREAELLDRIRELEARSDQAAELIAKAMGIMKPRDAG
jgi:hypothetical protein